MRIGIIGTGLMGSNLSRCLAGKGVGLVVYNRTKSRAEDLCREVGCRVVDHPRDLVDVDAVIVFVFDDEAVRSVLLGRDGLVHSGSPTMVLNSSTITPETSMYIAEKMSEAGFTYYEAPVYGSTDEARECKLVSLLAGDPDERGRAEKVAMHYSKEILYIGGVPKAMALKLALNNIGLSLPPIIGESLELLEAYDVSLDSFLEASSKLWFGGFVERYLGRITMPRGSVRFTVRGAAKDYRTISGALSSRGYPSIVSSALMNYYMIASYRMEGEDYPRAAGQFLKKKR